MTLDIIASDILTPGTHGFFTRKGGVSKGLYAGLNCGAGSADDATDVAENRARVAARFGTDAGALITVHQVHSADAVPVTAPFADIPRCDGVVTATPGLILGALSADCSPVLFEDRVAGVIGACHAGWRGALGGVIASTVAEMEKLGADRQAISAAVGPCLSQKNYEVGPEFFEDFLAENTAFARYFANGTGDRMQFDLPGFTLDQVRATGIGQAEWTGHCTYADPERFFSYRRNCHDGLSDYGRLIAAITL